MYQQKPANGTSGVLWRIVLGVYAVTVYWVACGLRAGGNVTLPVAFLITCGTVMYIVALGGMMIAHHSEQRPAWELFLPVLFPFVLYQALWGDPYFLSKGLWIFVGTFTFLQITGGFVLGLLAAPFVAAMMRPGQRDQIGARVRFGFQSIRARRLQGFGFVLAVGLAGAFAHATRGTLLHQHPLAQPTDHWSLTVALLAGILLIAGFMQRHTNFR